MNGGSITASLDRIEAVLDRLEAAARQAETLTAPHAADTSSSQPLGVPSGASVDEDAHADLERRHAQLRDAVSASLERLDTLIAQEDT